MTEAIRFQPSKSNLYPLEVKGESYHRKELASLFPSIGAEGIHAAGLTAHLVLEDDNVKSSNAVRVEIEGKHIGYLSSSAAQRYRRNLKGLGLGKIVGQCKAMIIGGYRMRDNTLADFGVYLDLDLENMKIDNPRPPVPPLPPGKQEPGPPKTESSLEKLLKLFRR